MGNISITPDGLVKHPHDPYWDAPISRREVQTAVNDIAENEKTISMQNDTMSIVLNFLCERLGVTRGELDAYAERKKAEIAAFKAAQKTQEVSGELSAR